MQLFRVIGVFFVLVFMAIGYNPAPQATAAPRFQKKINIDVSKVNIEELHAKTIKLYQQRKYEDAKKNGNRTLEISKIKFGLENPNVVISSFNLGLISQAQGNDREAIYYYEQALEILSKILWPNRPKRRTIEKSLTFLYDSRGKRVETRDIIKKVKLLLKKDFFPDHPDVAIILNNLAVIYKKEGKFAEAESLIKRALEIWEKNREKERHNITIAHKNLKIVKKEIEKARQAEDLLLGREQEERERKIYIAEIISNGDSKKGQEVYELRCAGCHGMKGDGNGATAKFLVPRPRDFTMGIFKLRTTPSGKPPTDRNLFKTISNGIPGTAMPAWRGVITDIDIANVLQYEKKFSNKWVRWEKKGRKIPEITIGPEIPSSPESIETGKNLFVEMECWRCHGKSGRGSGPSNAHLKDDPGDPIRPANFYKLWNLKGGNDKRAIYARISTGLLGTPMPSWADSLSNEELWHVVNFIRSLGPEKRPEVKEIVISKYVNGEIPMNYDDPLWKNEKGYFFLLVGDAILQAKRFWSNIDSLYIKSLHNGKEVAFLLEWDDSNLNPIISREKFPWQCNDAFFLQFPQEIIKEPRKPYFFPGDKNADVDLWFWESVAMDCRGPLGAKSRNPKFMAVKEDTPIIRKATYDDGRWLMIMKRAMKTGIDEELQFEPEKFIPISFHAQDGLVGIASKDIFLPFWHWLVLQPGFSSESFFSKETTISLLETK